MEVSHTPIFEGPGPWSIAGVQRARAAPRDDQVDLTLSFLREGHSDNYLYIQLTREVATRLADSLDTASKQIRQE